MTKHKQTQKIAMASTAVVLGLAGIVGMTVPTHAEGSEIKIDVNIKDALSLVVYPHGDHTTEANQLSLGDAMPGGDLAHNSLDLVVKTNVNVGYQLTMKDADNDTSLAQSGAEGAILAIETPTKASALPADRWGYMLGEYNENLNLYGVPAYSAEPALINKSISNLPNEGATTTVTFGAKIGTSLGTGVYEDTVMFTASPELIPTGTPTGMSEWTTGLYWDNEDQEGLYTWQAANEACMKQGKRLPSEEEYRELLKERNIADDATGATTITSAPYNFKINGGYQNEDWAIHSTEGHYWNSTLIPNNSSDSEFFGWMNELQIDSGRVYLGLENQVFATTNYGVRCVLDK